MNSNKPPQSPKKRRSTRPPEEHVRSNLVHIVAWLITVAFIVTIIHPANMPVLDKVIPMFTLILGYYLGYKNNQVPN